MSVIIIAVVLALSVAVLMVSNIRYHSFKDLDFKGKVPFVYILLMVILFAAIAANPAAVLLFAFMGYALSGPIQTLWVVNGMRKARRGE